MPVVRQPTSGAEETNAANQAACVADKTHRVTMTDPVVIPEQRVEPTVFEAVESDGLRVDRVVVPGFVIPRATVNTGCIIEEKAQPGCLGAVTITGYEVPGVRVPEVTIPERRLPDGSVQAAVARKGAEVEGVKVDPVTTRGVCQVTRENGRSAAVRSALTRAAATRPAITLAGVAQSAKTVQAEDDSGNLDAFAAPPRYVSPVAVGPVAVAPVAVSPGLLPYTALEGRPEVDVAEGKGTRAYIAPAKVLFDENKAVLRPAAQAALRSIVADLRTSSPTGNVTVDGYTDNQGSTESGLVLSRARAGAVTRWLTTKGGITRDRIVAVHGYGEAHPAAPNNSETNMAKNRRVVISVSR